MKLSTAQLKMGFTILELVATMALTGIVLVFISGGVLKWQGAISKYNKANKSMVKLNTTISTLDNILQHSHIDAIQNNSVLFQRSDLTENLKYDGKSLILNESVLLGIPEIDSMSFLALGVMSGVSTGSTSVNGKIDDYGCKTPPAKMLEIQYFPISRKQSVSQIIELKSPNNL